MKSRLRIWITLFFLAACVGGQGMPAVYAQDSAQAPQSAAKSSAPEQKQESDETGEFRHAPIVQTLARTFGLGTESAARIFEIINSGILIFTILFFLGKVVPRALRSRSANIQKRLDEARLETKTANERLGEVEAKLAKIGDEIEAIRQQTDRDMVQDEQRIKQALEDERQRIVQSAEQEIESASAAAKRELKRFAAELAVDNAAKRIQLTQDSDKALIERFGKDLTSQFGKGGQN